MPRNYIRKTIAPSPNKNNILAAIKDVRIEKKSLRAVATARNIPASSLCRYLKKIDAVFKDVSKATDDELMTCIEDATFFGGRPIFSDEQEEAIVKYIVSACRMCYGLSINDLLHLAFDFAQKVGVKYPENWNANEMATKDWYYGFLKRHPNISLRTPEQISANRMKAFSKPVVDAFFKLLDEVTTPPFNPKNIWNMDETGFSNVPTKATKVLSEKGVKRIGQQTSQERGTNVTVAFAINANGQSIPPFFFFALFCNFCLIL